MAQPTGQEVTRVITGYENAVAAVEYVDSLVLEMQQISGDDYKMVWSVQNPA